MFIYRSVLVAVCLLVAGCSGCKKSRVNEAAKEPPAQSSEAPLDESMFVVARPAVTSAPVPPRFSAPLPATANEFEPLSFPPVPFIRAALEANTFEMRRRFIDALKRAAAPGAIPDDVAGAYVDMIGYVPGTATCKWVVDSATSALDAAARTVLWKAAARCRDASLASSFLRDDVPDEVVVEWVFGSEGEMPYNQRVARAAVAVARTPKNDFVARKVGFVFARMQGEQSLAALRALQASIKDEHRRALVGLGMQRSSLPAARTIGKASCKHPKVANDAMCRGDDSAFSVGKLPDDLPGMIDYGFDAKELLAKFSPADVVTALTECTRTRRDHRARWCFTQLADVDHSAAVALAKKLVTSNDQQLARVARSVQRYPDPSAAEKALRDLGFVLDRTNMGLEAKPITVEDVLFARGRTEWFDAETGTFPNAHDALLAELAALASPVLDDVIFEEIPPAESEMDDGPYRLHAYADGKRYALRAENHGDWYDVHAVIGLVNALLVARNSDIRLVVLPTGDQMVKVVAGPAKGIRALVDAGLIDVGQADEAERAGKEFEDRVFEQMRQEGQDVQRNVPIAK